MGREIRRVPKDWKHLKRVKDQFQPGIGNRVEEQYRPMHIYRTFEEAVKEFQKDVSDWMKGYSFWQKGLHISYEGEIEKKEDAIRRWMKSIEDERKNYHYGESYREEEYAKYKTGICSYSDIAGDPPRYPDPDDYMPRREWYQLYETVSEGTPLTPPFATKEELIEWLVKNKDFWGEQWTREQAEAIVKYESSPSFIVNNGKIFNSRETLIEMSKDKE